MVKYCKYLWYIIRHKWFVGIECLKRGLWWQAITHDISKLRWDEFKPYAKWFFGEPNKLSFELAWLKHQHRNLHHWESWILRCGKGHTATLQMPDKYVEEMICDWLGAGKTTISKAGIEDVLTWYENNKNSMILHPASRAQVRRLLGVKKKLRNNINNSLPEPLYPFASIKIPVEVIGTAFDYATGYEDEVTVEDGTLTPQQIAEMDAEKKRLRYIDQQKQADEQREQTECQQ